MPPLHTTDIIADMLIDARRTMGQFPARKTEAAPADLAEVYAIQDKVAQAVGSVGGFKFGRKTPQERPVFAPIFTRTIRRSPARFERSELNILGVELEIAFYIHSDLPALDAEDYALRVRDCISPLAAIEVVDTRLSDHEAAGPLWKLADNQINAGLVTGEPLENWTSLDMTGGTIRLTAGDRTLFAGRGNVPGGNALDGFVAFARAVGNHCGGLCKGQYVTTGSLSGLDFVPKGTTVIGEIAGLGNVELRTEL